MDGGGGRCYFFRSLWFYFGCTRFYRRDAAELSRSVGVTLIFLRLTTIIALLFFFFDFQRRTQREITRPSEVVVLVDTSQSMSLAESDALGSESRAKRASMLLSDGNLVERLGQEHRVSVYGFGETAEPMLLESVGAGGLSLDEPAEAVPAERPTNSAASLVAVAGIILLGLSAALSIASLLIGGLTVTTGDSRGGPKSERLGWLLGVTAVTMCLGILLCGSAYSVATSRSFASLIGFSSGPADPQGG